MTNFWLFFMTYAISVIVMASLPFLQPREIPEDEQIQPWHWCVVTFTPFINTFVAITFTFTTIIGWLYRWKNGY